MKDSRTLLAIIVSACLCAAAFAAEPGQDADNKQSKYSNPDEAFKALIAGWEKNSDEQLLDVLGHAHKDLVVRSDKDASTESREELCKLAKENLKIVVDGDKAVACLGSKCWPYPIPLAKSADGWRFDTAEGKEEILSRRIGRNELSALKLLDAYDDAQREYAEEDHTGDKVSKYAQKLISTQGKKDGLFWAVPAESKDAPSPLAGAVEEGDELTASPDVPYNGYYFKILTKQGEKPPNGKYNYVINGNMIAGFALVAWPADYEASGVMTFVISHQGVTYQKDLGKDTAKLAGAMDEYNPDETWKEVKPEEK